MDDQELEKAIEEVGREKVFQRARNIGWMDDTPPAWVWWGIVNELRTVGTQALLNRNEAHSADA